MKTTPNQADVGKFLAKVDAERRGDCAAIVAMMKAATRAEPVMYGKSIIGFGHRKLVYPNGRELDWFQLGFSPRKSDLTLYVGLGGLEEKHGAMLDKLGKHKAGKGCLYVRRLADVDVTVLKKLLQASAAR